jgi:peptide maturation system acyl carrier-related protein
MRTQMLDHETELKIIMQRLFQLNMDELLSADGQALDKNLMGDPFHLKPRDFLYLYDAVETQFAITISPKVIISGEFKTFHDILNCIQIKEIEKPIE